LAYVFETVPSIDIKNDAQLDRLLPTSELLPSDVRTSKKSRQAANSEKQSADK
jgi:hypothetical protein